MDDVALAVPRVALPGGNDGVSLPQPLTPSDAARLRRIFTLQAKGDIPAAIRAIDEVSDPLLLGDVLAERYLGRWHRSTPTELADWLTRYPDLPDAPAIRALLQRREPSAVPPAEPAPVVLMPPAQAVVVPEDAEPAPAALARNPALDRTVLDRAQRGQVASALRLIDGTKGLSDTYAAQLRAEVAQILFTQNKDAEALRVALGSLRDTAADSQVALTGYIGGLAAWRLGRPDQARILFAEAVRAPIASPRLHAAAAFWASRASRREHDAVGAVRWLRIAAEEPRTLHGLLARRILGMHTGIMPSGDLVTQADVDAVADMPEGWRAFALLQIGQADRAEAALRQLWPAAKADRAFARSLLLVASGCGMNDLTAELATQMQAEDGRPRDEFRFPLPRLRPAGGFSVDPALVYALARIESNFDTSAVSPAGARGLMQLMPVTAQYIVGNPQLSWERLHDPGFNLALGQRYVRYLAKLDGIDDDLIRVLASYNSGPGNFLRWGAEVRDGGDPLMFLEAIPVPETRGFVTHVLTYTWIYAARLHVPAPSLDALAAGSFPRFTPPAAERTLASLVSARLN
ncbi:MAG: lytic transglycosylase domain-containing protein [Rhodospirillales bacterium]|nr:lytic transglycosylase domain-containing protein [Rhodospirillales bacterium]